ncbi:MAG: CHAD domain-containing protein [Anaerolineaceae bacterium]|nr:CHAD domain-containing protein [Anaerolineaceae bacterium]
MKSKVNPDICVFGAAAILQQTKNLKQDWEGVHSANQDIEYVHRMRVATRRFRSIFDIFARCLPKKKRKVWKKEITRLTKALSTARDLDVHIAMLTEFSQALPEPQHHPGINRLLLRLRQEREQVQPKIDKALNRIQKTGAVEDLETALKRLLPPQTDAPSAYPSGLYQLAFKSINRGMNKLLVYDGRIQDPKNITELHELRLEAKNLRYIIEIFQDLYTDRLESQLVIVQDMQSQLGVIHDEDNWIAGLDTFLKTERERTLAYYGHEGPFNLLKPGINLLRDTLKKDRQQQYHDFIHKWERWKTENLWGSLYQVTKLPTIIYQPEREPVAAEKITEELASQQIESPGAVPAENHAGLPEETPSAAAFKNSSPQADKTRGDTQTP